MGKSSIYILPSVTGEETLDSSQSVSFDAVTDLSIKKSRSISNSPLSSGSYISEHLTDKGGTITMEAYVSNNPIVLYQNNLIPTLSDDGRAQAGYTVLNALYESQNVVTIVHMYDTVDNYFLTDFEPIVMPDDSIGFRLSFSEVRYATEKRVQLLTYMSDTKAIESAQNTSAGDTQVEEADEEDVAFSMIKKLYVEGEGFVSGEDTLGFLSGSTE